MQPIECRQCGTTVLAEKYSPQHTSVQWLDDAAAACPRLGSQRTDGSLPGNNAPGGDPRGTTNSICPALHATIDRAVAEGTLDYTHRVEPTPGKLG